MKSMRLPAIAISAVLGFVACSDDKGTDPNGSVPQTDPYGYNVPGSEIPGGNIPGYENPGSEIPSGDVPGTEIPGNENPYGEIPGGEVPGGENPGAEIPGGDVPGSNLPGDVSSSSALIPGGDTPILSSSSVGGTVPGTNPGGESGDDENDNEDSRTLDGTQILLKLSGTSATVENNNGCVEVADKAATITKQQQLPAPAPTT